MSASLHKPMVILETSFGVTITEVSHHLCTCSSEPKAVSWPGSPTRMGATIPNLLVPEAQPSAPASPHGTQPPPLFPHGRTWRSAENSLVGDRSRPPEKTGCWGLLVPVDGDSVCATPLSRCCTPPRPALSWMARCRQKPCLTWRDDKQVKVGLSAGDRGSRWESKTRMRWRQFLQSFKHEQVYTQEAVASFIEFGKEYDMEPIFLCFFQYFY